jgi:hypothetical protein
MMWCDLYDRLVPKFQSNLLPPSSGLLPGTWRNTVLTKITTKVTKYLVLHQRIAYFKWNSPLQQSSWKNSCNIQNLCPCLKRVLWEMMYTNLLHGAESPWEANQFSATQIPHILQNPKFHYRLQKCLPPVSIQSISPCLRLTLWISRNRIRIYGEELLTPRPTPKLEDHPLSAVGDCLFNIFAATLHIGGCFSIRNRRTRHVWKWK